MPKTRRNNRAAAPTNLTEESLNIEDLPVLPRRPIPRRRQRATSTQILLPESSLDAETSQPIININNPPDLHQNVQLPTADNIAQALIARLNQNTSLTGLLSNSAYVSTPSELNNANNISTSIQNNNSAVNVSNVNDVPASLIPPVTADRNFLNINTASMVSDAPIEGTNSIPVTFGSVSLIKHSLPLAYHVNEKTRNLIFSDICVDFAALLPHPMPTENSYDIASGVTLTTNTQVIKSLANIFQWHNAFDIFMTIYVSKFPNLTVDLIKYANKMRKLSYDYGFQAAKFYDEEFRRLRYIYRLDWTTIHDELWRLAIGETNSSNRNSGRPQSSSQKQKSPFHGRLKQKSSSYPKGFCWKFCETAHVNTNVQNVVKNMPQTHVMSNHKIRLPTPIKVDRLAFYLRSYDPHLRDFLVTGFTEGFRLGAQCSKTSVLFIKSHKSALERSEIVFEKIHKELLKGRYKGPFDNPSFPNSICSPLGLVPKKEAGKFRVINDLSFPKGDFVNSSIPMEYTSVSYENIENVVRLVKDHGFNALMGKSDVEEAFRLLPLHNDEHHLLGFMWEGKKSLIL